MMFVVVASTSLHLGWYNQCKFVLATSTNTITNVFVPNFVQGGLHRKGCTENHAQTGAVLVNQAQTEAGN